LPPKLGPIVHAAVQEAMTSPDKIEKENQMDGLIKRVTILNNIVIGLGVAVLALAVLAFI